MEINSNDLPDKLTSPRLPDEGELNEVMSRAVLGMLRHGDESKAVRHDCFGMFANSDFVTIIQQRFQSMAQEAKAVRVSF